LKYSDIEYYLILFEVINKNIFYEYDNIKEIFIQTLEELDWYREFYNNSKIVVNKN